MARHVGLGHRGPHVVAHVRDVRKGLVSLYTGEREITVKNKRLAAALYHATRG